MAGLSSGLHHGKKVACIVIDLPPHTVIVRVKHLHEGHRMACSDLAETLVEMESTSAAGFCWAEDIEIQWGLYLRGTSSSRMLVPGRPSV